MADNNDEEGSTHTNLYLRKDGEEIGLIDIKRKGKRKGIDTY